MSEHNCISRFTFLILIIIICSFSVFYSMGNKKRTNKEIIRIINKKQDNNLEEDKEIINYINQKYDIKNEKNYNINKKEIVKNEEIVKINDELIEQDRRVIYDPIKEPVRRLPRHIFNKDSIKKYINIPTRGYPDNYQLVGLLSRQSDEKFLQLYGRQKYPGASQWEYYVRGRDLSGLETKIPISVHNDNEIYENDEVDVPLLDSSKGKFKASIYKIDTLKYNPHVY